MAAAKGAKRSDVERRIHFYRADCGRGENGIPFPFEPGAAFTHIDGLPFAPLEDGGRYYETDDNIYCCWIDSPQRARFAVIRRDALPHIEEGGIVRALDISETAGLVEQIHVRHFPPNIVGFDFNFYGPRLGRLGTYLHMVGDGKCRPTNFMPLLRDDIAAELEDGKELRFLALRIKRSMIDVIGEIDESLASGFRGVQGLGDAAELEIVLRPRPYSGNSIGTKLMKTTRRLAQRGDIRDIADLFKIKVGAPGHAAEAFDVLGDHFIFDRRILRQTEKGRALDSVDAYAQIEDAFGEREEELTRAAALDAQ